MSVNKHHHNSRENGHSVASRRKSNGVVDAVIMQQPDLSIFLKFQNVLNYFIDCMNTFSSSAELNATSVEHISRCITHIEQINMECITFCNNEMRMLMKEFIDDANTFKKLIQTICNTKETSQTDTIQLIAKSLHLQWLSVCILQEIKTSYLST